MIKVAVQKAGEGGVAFYRITQPYSHVAKDSNFNVLLYDSNKHSQFHLNKYQNEADILVYQMPWGDAIEKILDVNESRTKPKKIILEYDDNIFNMNPFNDSYEHFGTEEVQTIVLDKETIDRYLAKGRKPAKLIPNTIKRLKELNVDPDKVKVFDMWRNGERGFDAERNLKHRMATQRAIQRADAITTTTQYLGKALRKFRPTGPIFVMPNLIDSNRWMPMEKNDTNELRIGWQGGSAHFLDIYMITTAIDKILEKHKNVKFVFKGGHFPSLFEQWPDRVEWITWHPDIMFYPLDVRKMKLDIAIAPVIDDNFNRAKSELKFLEYGLLKVPAVYSDVTYGGVVKHDKTGFIAKTSEDWFKYLDLLITNEQKRKEITEKAFTRVFNYHTVQNAGDMYKDMLRDVLYGINKSIKVA